MNKSRLSRLSKPIILIGVLSIACLCLGACTSASGGEPGQRNLWDMFVQLMASAVEGLFNIVHDWGLAILIFTIIFRAILTPLMIKQTKSTYMMQKMQPKIQEIQTRFADDPARVQQETQRLYADAKYNPLAGCLPMLLQMPIFIALFQALRNIQDFVSWDGAFTFYGIIPDLLKTPSEMWEQGIEACLPYIMLMIIFAGATFLPMLFQQTSQQQQKTTMIMAVVMTLFMLWVGWSSPAGVLMYWGVSSLLGVLQSTLARRHFKKLDEAKEAEIAEIQPVVIDVTRKPKKKRPTKKR